MHKGNVCRSAVVLVETSAVKTSWRAALGSRRRNMGWSMARPEGVGAGLALGRRRRETFTWERKSQPGPPRGIKAEGKRQPGDGLVRQSGKKERMAMRPGTHVGRRGGRSADWSGVPFAEKGVGQQGKEGRPAGGLLALGPRGKEAGSLGESADLGLRWPSGLACCCGPGPGSFWVQPGPKLS